MRRREDHKQGDVCRMFGLHYHETDGIKWGFGRDDPTESYIVPSQPPTSREETLRAAALEVVKQAETDDNYEGAYIDYLIAAEYARLSERALLTGRKDVDGYSAIDRRSATGFLQRAIAALASQPPTSREETLRRHLDFCSGGEFCSLDDCLCECHPDPDPLAALDVERLARAMWAATHATALAAYDKYVPAGSPNRAEHEERAFEVAALYARLSEPVQSRTD